MSAKVRKRLAFALGSIAALLGVLALIAWGTDRHLTIGALSGKMRPELAVALCCGGAAILASLMGRSLILAGLGVATVAASAAVLWDTFSPAAAGLLGALPMQPVSAGQGAVLFASSAMLCAGLGLALLLRWPNVSVSFGLMCAGVGFIFLLDRALEATAPLPWPDTMATSARTGAALVVLGLGVFLEGSRMRPRDRSAFTPYMVGGVGILASVVFWNILTSQEKAGLDRLLEATAAGLRAELSVAVNEVIADLEILAERTGRTGRDLERWESRTRRLIRSHPSIVAIDWIAPDGVLLASVRSESAAVPVSLSYPGITELERLRADLPDAPSALVQAYPQFPESLRITALVEAHASASGSASVLEAVVDMRQLVSSSVTATDLANSIEIRVGDTVVFDNPGTNLAAPEMPVGEVTWQPPAADNWSISVGPSQNLVISALSPLPNVVLGAGILISLLMAVVLRGNEIQSRRAVQLEEAVRKVESQAEELRGAQERLRDLNEDLEGRVRARTEELSRANAYLSEENRLRTRAQQRLTRVNENLRRFDAFISHELRQPLAAMRLWMDLLESTARDSLSEKQRGYLEKSSGEIRRMTRLIEDELRLSKASHGEPPTEAVRLDDILASIAEEMQPRLAEVGGRLEIGALPVLRASETQMQQLFTNLVDNAIKYCRSDVAPLIRIEARWPLAGKASDGGGETVCELVVEDNGRGFAIEPGENVFDMFSRRPGDEETPGWGIGLAICKRIVERHEGSIWAESRPGEGTRMHVLLPLATADLEAESAAPPVSGA